MSDASVVELGRARSFLFVPGDRPERFGKAAGAGADVVVLDLEDAVAGDNTQAAREHIATWLDSGGRGVVRVCASDTHGHRADVDALVGLPGLQGVMLAKAERAEAVAEVAERTGVPVIPLVESAAGLARSEQMARARGAVRLAFGHLDMAADIGSTPERGAMLYARSALVFASRLGGLPGPIDGVTADLDSPDAVSADIRYASSLGMTGKLLIHPKQVAAAHSAMQPTEQELAWANSVATSLGDGGVTRVDGVMVDAPVLARAEAILARSR